MKRLRKSCPLAANYCHSTHVRSLRATTGIPDADSATRSRARRLHAKLGLAPGARGWRSGSTASGWLATPAEVGKEAAFGGRHVGVLTGESARCSSVTLGGKCLAAVQRIGDLAADHDRLLCTGRSHTSPAQGPPGWRRRHTHETRIALQDRGRRQSGDIGSF